MNKPAKDYLRKEFQNWYSEKLMEEVEDENSDIADISPINLGMPTLKELGAKWLVQMSEYISDNPQFIVNGFIRSGISGALDGIASDESNERSEEEWTDEESDDSSEESAEES